MKIQHTCVSMTRKLRFESGVISYGNQTLDKVKWNGILFESGVISYGNQTCWFAKLWLVPFESGVISYGNQTHPFVISIASLVWE